MQYIYFLLFVVLLSGCTQTQPLMYTKSETVQEGFHTKNVHTTYINYASLADAALASIFSKTKVPSKVIVTDFVDITSLDNHVRLGYVLSNNIKNSLINNYKVDVVEAEVSKYFKISGNGLKVLSRDAKKVRSTSFNVKHALVGTYTHSENELIVFIKLIDLKTGIIKGSYAKTFPMGIGTRMMLERK